MADAAHMWGHQSLWDRDMMANLLSEVGFEGVEMQEFRSGGDPALLRDDPEKSWETLHGGPQAPMNKTPGGFPPRALDGAGDEIRTHDFNLGKVALYP